MATNFPPRGNHDNTPEVSHDATWANPLKLGHSWTYEPGMILLGEWEGRKIGRKDDRHIVTIAGSRAGKSRTVLIPNLKRYPGSAIIIDPKGELAQETAQGRRDMGQRVVILDPLGELKRRGCDEESASFNPLSELATIDIDHQPGEAAALADSLIVQEGKDPHWQNSARKIVHAVILHLLSGQSEYPATIGTITRFFGSTEIQQNIYAEMLINEAFDGFLKDVADSNIQRMTNGSNEYNSIISTGDAQLAPLRDIDRVSQRSDFQLKDLHAGMTIYLVLPATKISTHFRWLRLMINQAIAAMERHPVPYGQLPVWFVLEEFAALGHMRSIETAAGYMAGYGVKLWTILQDLTQLKTHYPKSWETFLGNAGIIQTFGTVDATTNEYLSKLLGQTTISEIQKTRVTARGMAEGDTGSRENLRSLSLLDAAEISYYFARETGRQMIISPGRPPIYIDRLKA